MGYLDGDMRRECGPPPPAAVAEFASERWGVVSRAQLRELGLSRDAIDHWLRAGRLHLLYRGVYAVGHTALRREGRFLAAVLACGPGAALSYLSGAAHRGLLATDQALIDVTAARARRGAPGIRLHRSRLLDPRDTEVHQGIPTTTVARTLLDLAATVSAGRLERALAQAERLRLYDHRAIVDVMQRNNGHRGASVLAAATAAEPKLTRSDWEIRLLGLVRTAGLPEPLVNFILDAPDHGRIEVDFYWPAHRLVVETDGWESHRTNAAFKADRAKDAALTAAGYRVIRLTWDVDDATVLRRLRSLLA